MAKLFSFSGLPGVGKTTIARALSKEIGAVHLRLDSIETALKNSSLKIDRAEEAGYLVVAAVAKDNLMLGLDVIADTVNPLEITRQLWVDAVARADAELINIEIICSNIAQHRKRVQSRISDIVGHTSPNWADVVAREYDSWTQQRLVLDSGQLSASECVAEIIRALNARA